METYRGNLVQCDTCGLCGQCRGGKAPRTVKRDCYTEDVRAHEAKMKTPEAKAIMAVHRAAAEGGVAELKVHRLLERAREKGLARMTFRAYMCAIVSNTKRLVRALEEQQAKSDAA